MHQPYCPHLGSCGGCPWGLLPLDEQRDAKRRELNVAVDNIEFAELPQLGLRDRADLVWDNGKLGLYSLNSREILDLRTCAMMSPRLLKFFERYRQVPPPGVRRGSVRLRVSPAGEPGVWLDFANVDVKTLFDEVKYLEDLSGYAFVEIGQRRKALTFVNGLPKLTAPILKPWFETYGPRGEAIPLFGPVGGFSQSGFLANRRLVEQVALAAAASNVQRWTELFAGNGNFALALASRGFAVKAVELDPLATEGFRLAVKAHREWQVELEQGDVYRQSGRLEPTPGLLVDPPRSGLREVLRVLGDAAEPPRALIYVSCFSETFTKDTAALEDLGYRLRTLKGVDQFANSPHAEWVALFEKI